MRQVGRLDLGILLQRAPFPDPLSASTPPAGCGTASPAVCVNRNARPQSYEAKKKSTGAGVRQSATDQPFSDRYLGVGRSKDRRDTHHTKTDAGVTPVELAALLTTRVREKSNHCPDRA